MNVERDWSKEARRQERKEKRRENGDCRVSRSTPTPFRLRKEEGGIRSSDDQVGEPSWRPTGEPSEAIPVGYPGRASGSRNERKSADIGVLDAIIKPESRRSTQ